MAGKANKGNKRLKDYGKVLMAKQLLKAIYNNPRERVFKRFFGKKMEVFSSGSNTHLNKGSRLLSEPINPVPTINKVFTSLSSRLEIILTAMGGALSHQHARQLINHGKVSVNGYTVKQRNYLLKDGDIIVSKAGLNYSIPVGSNQAKLKDSGILSESLSKEDSQKSSGKIVQEREKRQALFQLEKKVGGMKTIKLPKYLKIKTPVAASLLINPELNLGIYYSKALFTHKTNLENTSISEAKTSQTVQNTTGWKNMSVKELKLLLASPHLSTWLSQSKAQNSVFGSTSLIADKKLAPQKGSILLTKEEQEKWKNLYSLVQAYYLRK